MIEPFTISRELNAPRDRVWKAWTEVEHLKKWFGPAGFVMTQCKLDLRPGGIFHYCMRAPDGKEMWGKWVFREIVAPERIALVNSFSDAAGGITRPPMAPNWPREMLSTTTFTEKNGKKTLTLEWQPINATPEEIATFESGRPGMAQGWTGTMDQLTVYLGKPKS